MQGTYRKQQTYKELWKQINEGIAADRQVLTNWLQPPIPYQLHVQLQVQRLAKHAKYKRDRPSSYGRYGGVPKSQVKAWKVKKRNLVNRIRYMSDNDYRLRKLEISNQSFRRRWINQEIRQHIQKLAEARSKKHRANIYANAGLHRIYRQRENQRRNHRYRADEAYRSNRLVKENEYRKKPAAQARDRAHSQTEDRKRQKRDFEKRKRESRTEEEKIAFNKERREKAQQDGRNPLRAQKQTAKRNALPKAELAAVNKKRVDKYHARKAVADQQQSGPSTSRLSSSSS